MATVTTGLLSPNSYGLNPDQVAAKMAAQNSTEEEFDHYATRQCFGSQQNSSDSEDNYTVAIKQESPKRNKRKNFKPRCASNALYNDYPENDNALNLSEYSENNNIINSRRRKTQSTRRVVVDPRFFPIDLSQKNDSSDSESFNESNSVKNEFEDDNLSSENDSKIPSSFSIHNLSKPHVQKYENQNLGGLGDGAQGFPYPQISDMREFAMNTMRELLGIYGLTSDVTESITKQLPIAAFNNGKLFENFNFHTPSAESISPNQPPTPPSTPLSPKTTDVSNKYTSNFSNIPNLTITSSSQNSSSKSQLQLVKRFKALNGESKAFPNSEMTNSGMEMGEDKGEKTTQINSRGMFSGYTSSFPYGQIKTENSSSPPLEQSPLNAMIAQSLSATPLRDTVPSSTMLMNKTPNQLDYSKYVKKFSSAHECGSSYCKDLNYREHFHCLDCNSRVFIKKEEMIRHFKWHKKRDDSLQHGFMRYSPLDDCSERFANCTHNKKQTHYHCIKEGCDKVYISTSDVQMHANYHRKDSAIIQEGFQRYRATEECGASYCAFFGQRTTHFHCRRSGCRFTFKNKSDMEKHKSYHIKDEQLSRDGFKKFMKNEVCPFENCRFSRVCNHIHCIRPQCSYVLHSSGQLFSHKRKHERKDSELAYRKYKLAQSMMKTMSEGNLSNPFGREFDNEALNMSQQQFETLNLSRQHLESINLTQGSLETFNNSIYTQEGTSNISNCGSISEENSPMSYDDENSAMDLSAYDNSNHYQPDDSGNTSSEDFWRKYIKSYGPMENCESSCEFNGSMHYHCITDGCQMILNSKEGVREHGRNHDLQDQITENFFTIITAKDGVCEESCIYGDKEKHYHCNWENCKEVILPSEKPFRRLEHYKMHEYSKKLSLTKDPLTMTHLATSIDGMFCRKRGRPPKNRVIEVWSDYSSSGNQSMMDSPQAIFTSFKLPKPFTTPSGSKELDQVDSNDEWSNEQSNSIQELGLQGFDIFNENTKCPDHLCPYLGSTHYHCNQNRCLYVTDKEDVLIMHSKDFHDNIEILDNFEFYDRNVDCRLSDCASNKINRHFHCTRPNCNYSFVQYSTMAIHNQKHLEETRNKLEEMKMKSENLNEDHKSEASDSGIQYKAMNLSSGDKVSVVKASGTFYPLSTLPTEQNKKTNDLSKNVDTETTSRENNILYGPEICCSRPFCKLKRKYHYHCNACNQAFSEIEKLVVHTAKHSTGALNSQIQEDNNNQQTSTSSNNTPVKTESKINVAPLQSLQNPITTKQETEHQYLQPTFDPYFSNFPPNLQFALLQQHQNAAFLPQSLYQNPSLPQLMFQHSQLMQSPLLPSPSSYSAENSMSPLAAMAANLNKRSLSPHEMSQEQKKVRIQNSMRILKDEPVPEGYLRFRFNEDCHYQHCGYREHQTHFHCQRQDCGYSFCDKTRFVQHTARHERLDTLMGGDFQQYRANVACGRPECSYTSSLGSTQNKASHFHCLKCDFVCTDTNKVVAHRRQHQKLDSIQAAGFEKFTPSQNCRVINCQHSGKQTHYHCLQCQYAVLGLAQMSAHKYRHLEN
ncbi:zinc finger protein castor homolog 1-like isoform X1 [Harmonia axyridis]|uniref:zinc finger protein castor homolog 1-like isoform X1 n=1 Tax=Harmonia axyridis TaxID=115357 RepID=UPI001E27784B|nr:zinc finger protein castor homolog 1-like isoform X1 [Harmonia axyridis]